MVKFFSIPGTVILAASCFLLHSCASKQQESVGKDEPTTVNNHAPAPAKPRITGESDNIYKIVTSIYSAKLQNGQIVKDGEPDLNREYEAFPNPDTKIYGIDGRVDSVISSSDGINYISVYSYNGNQMKEEKLYQNGELFYDRKYEYKGNERVNTIENLYIAGDLTTNEYPLNPAKVKYEKNGNRIEYGNTKNDYTITDTHGRLIKESSYSEMDDYLSIIEYSYNDKGWQTACTYENKYHYTFDYTNIDDRGNWLEAIIRCNGEPYGIVERKITYY